MGLVKKRCPFCGSEVMEIRPDYELAMRIITEVADEHLITPEELISPSRTARYVTARDCAALRLRHAGFMLKEIGMYLGGRDHSTIHHSLQKATA